MRSVGQALTRADLTHRTSLRSASRTSARRRWSGTRPPATRHQRDRVAGHPNPAFRRRAGRPAGRDRYRTVVGPAARDLLRRAQDRLDPRQRRRGPRRRPIAENFLFGTMDTWLIWNLTGGVERRHPRHRVTNASRTMLMDLDTLTWDDDIAAEMGIPLSMLPEIRSSSELYGHGRAHGMLPGVPLAGILGDQQAATFGQACFEPARRRTPTEPATSSAQHRRAESAQRRTAC